jgi:hypothetical protein
VGQGFVQAAGKTGISDVLLKIKYLRNAPGNPCACARLPGLQLPDWGQLHVCCVTFAVLVAKNPVFPSSHPLQALSDKAYSPVRAASQRACGFQRGPCWKPHETRLLAGMISCPHELWITLWMALGRMRQSLDGQGFQQLAHK